MAGQLGRLSISALVSLLLGCASAAPVQTSPTPTLPDAATPARTSVPVVATARLEPTVTPAPTTRVPVTLATAGKPTLPNPSPELMRRLRAVAPEVTLKPGAALNALPLVRVDLPGTPVNPAPSVTLSALLAQRKALRAIVYFYAADDTSL